MENNSIKTTQGLEDLATALFTTLAPNKLEKDLYTASFTVCDYSHLMFIITDLMKLCVSAIEDESGFGSYLKINIGQILKIAIELLPSDEAAFLDRSRELFAKESGNDVSKIKISRDEFMQYN
ncbi:hypothetical protein [Flavobacterium aestivum]|uniref:hypothetical protein n=1 Tax=Flavobacterium aestivum TaxID=3003257 RepID=UPI002285CBBD|nr:hypothetical protein [Flavobacterium aestivum]